MKLRVGFILPTSEYLFDPFRGDPFTHFHILTILEDVFGDKIEPLLIDLRGVKKRFMINHIPECDIFLHSVYTLDFVEQCEIVASLRKYYPRAVHIAGGPHVNVYPDECSLIFDSLIFGEGEERIVCAVRDFFENTLQRTYRQSGIVDIDLYPYWRRHFLPKSATVRSNMLTLKRKQGLEKLKGTTAMFSRGCPYRCHFCAIDYARREAPGIRFRAPAHIESEIEYLKHEYGVEGLSLTDEIVFPLQRQAAIKHLEAIGRAGILWRGQCRVDGVNDETAALARQAGCIALGMGVESVVQRCLDIINKRISVAKAREAIRILKQNDIEARLYLIIGLPGEPDNIVDITWQFIQETEPDLVYLSLFTIRPGTEVFRCPDTFGITRVNTDWTKTMHLHNSSKDDKPSLTFEYAAETPWGRGMSSDTIIGNFLELQTRLQTAGLHSFEFFKDAHTTGE